MVSDTSVISEAVMSVVSANLKSVEEYKNGNKKALGFFVGQIMKKLEGKADPQVVNALLVEALDQM
jgi:aspartyl-tRNA(Asn)/glutamyl-tRNA(Gln) amidotransferase subunit B